MPREPPSVDARTNWKAGSWMRWARTTRPAESIAGSASLLERSTATRPLALFVLGMGRSGTSALTRVLSLCGAALPAGMMGADANNPLGYWEPRAAVMLNESILRREDSNWYDPTLRLQEARALGAGERAAYIARIQGYLATLPAAPLVVIKDPRITALADLWFEAARMAGMDVRAAIAVRHPEEVIASAAKYARTSPELSSALWLKYNLLAERHTRGVPRVFVDYATFLDDWRRETKRISAALDVNLDTSKEDVVEEFLTSELRRERHCGTVMDRFGTDWMSAVYAALCAAAQDDPVDIPTLDRVYQSYRAGDRDFRAALKDFHGHTNSRVRRVFRPFIVKQILEIAAIAHRRKGTWA